jgi:hypothetical protein
MFEFRITEREPDPIVFDGSYRGVAYVDPSPVSLYVELEDGYSFSTEDYASIEEAVGGLTADLLRFYLLEAAA